MTQITFRRVIWRLWKVEKITDPHGNPLRLDPKEWRREVFNPIKRLAFGYVWYHPCYGDKQIYHI